MNSASPLASMTNSLQPSSQQDPLARLQDVMPPLDPGFWPPPFWFYGVIVLVIIGLVCLFIAVKKQQGPRWYRTAKSALKVEINALRNTPNSEQLAQLNQILKRIAYKIEGRHQVAALQGENWCQWLDKKGKCKDFTAGSGHILADIYNPKLSLTDRQVKELGQVILKWLHAQKNAKTQQGVAINDTQILAKTEPENPSNTEKATDTSAPQKNELTDILSKVKKDIESIEHRIKGRHD